MTHWVKRFYPSYFLNISLVLPQKTHKVSDVKFVKHFLWKNISICDTKFLSCLSTNELINFQYSITLLCSIFIFLLFSSHSSSVVSLSTYLTFLFFPPAYGFPKHKHFGPLAMFCYVPLLTAKYCNYILLLLHSVLAFTSSLYSFKNSSGSKHCLLGSLWHLIFPALTGTHNPQILENAPDKF